MWTYIFLGILQGIFEWLPISSEGVVALTSKIFLLNINPVDIALFLHLGTVFAVLIYFRKDWLELLTFKNQKLLRFLIISTIVSLVVAYPIYKTIKEQVLIGNTLLLITGFALLFTAYFNKVKKSLNLDFGKLAFISGFLQGFSVIPGLSRSGSTVFGLSLGDLSASEILKVSYMMSVPVVLASTFYIFLDNPNFFIEGAPALISSFLVGFLTLDFLMKAFKKVNFFKFALFFGLLCLFGALMGFLV